MAQTIGEFAVKAAEARGMPSSEAQEIVAAKYGNLANRGLSVKDPSIANGLLHTVWALAHDLADGLGVKDEDIDRWVLTSKPLDAKQCEQLRVMLLVTLKVRSEWFRLNRIVPTDKLLQASQLGAKGRRKPLNFGAGSPRGLKKPQRRT